MSEGFGFKWHGDGCDESDNPHEHEQPIGLVCGQPVFPDHPEWGPILCNQETGHDSPHAEFYRIPR